MRPVCQKWTSELGGVVVRMEAVCRAIVFLPANAVASYVNDAFIWLGV
jgi:hypothetical protein